uniref:LAGLIDADG endonuclease n=1 Tax=Fusarium cerealis TaxID=56641 RepID=A0A6G6B1P1_FUSCE|nr:LAGLIDADG endonuclease [Fusarium cerealis]QID41890.1 LAGLIDADG endonuclease [Fusarium cerealis]QID41942.1 LAGLIDADG endonuclease [Fusarium cerealis]QID41994.1 LAGLIDADG endonuclease [Fusarium cerealis]QID42047.1 LAGLIDADG endonuclease [Fusarium cerealis]QID42100.1 LAGLIDADG endonuclease [Fusarium cerealis]
MFFSKKKITEVALNNNQNNTITITNSNNNNSNKNNDEDKIPLYTKVYIENPFNNRNLILKVSKNQKGVYSPTPNNLNPYWVTGFADAESCFGFRVRKNLKLKLGWEVIPYFSINLHTKDLSILLDIKKFFGVGNISSGKETAIYQVNSTKDLLNAIIPHFELYPLLTKKRADYLLFKSAIELIKQQEHKYIEGLHKLIGIKASLNKGILNEELNSYFNNIVPQERTSVPLPEVINPYWFAGFTSGDGIGFASSVEILKSSSHKIGYQVILKFLIIQHSRDLELLKCFISFLGGGFIKERTNISEYVVVKLSLITDKLIPLFQKHHIIGNKNNDFLDFCKIAELMNSNAHKTPEGLAKILEIKSGMNTKRK